MAVEVFREAVGVLGQIVAAVNVLRAAGGYAQTAGRAVQLAVRNVLTARSSGLLTGVDERLARQLLRIDEVRDSTVTTVAGTQHPQWKQRGHPADRLAQAFAAKALGAESLFERPDFVADEREVIPSALGNDLLIFGSPISNEVSKILYDYYGRNPFRQRRSNDPAFRELRWTFLLDAPQASATLAYFTGSGGPNHARYPVRNWQISDAASHTSFGARIEGGRGVNDFLLITRLRNFLTDEAFSAQRTLTLVGGSHGLGTAGFGLLLRDRATLGELLRAAGDGEFQALVEVGEPRTVRWRHPMPTTDEWLYDQFPRSLRIVDIERLRIPDETYLRRARPRMKPRLTRYFRRHFSAEA